MLKNWKKKLQGNDGFTLVEMLIVVAIIAILIAISIPLVNSALEKARHSTDAANERAAKAVILIAELNNELEDGGTFDPKVTYYYNAKDGKLVVNSEGAGKYGQHGTHKDSYITVKLDDDSKVSLQWAAGGDNLCSTAEKVKHMGTTSPPSSGGGSSESGN